MNQPAMNRTVQFAPVRKSLVVEASPDRAFEIFTKGIDRWWPKTHGIGAGPLVRSVLETHVGGRWYTTHEDGSEVTVGHIRVCEVGRRLVFGWEIGANWKPDSRIAFASEVEVRFTAEGAGRTRIDLEHRDFEKMGETDGATMRGSVENGWPKILELFAAEAKRAGNPGGAA